MCFINKKISKAALITLGCPKNEVDSEVLAGLLVRHHIQLVSLPEEADVIFINTCGFIKDAKEESINAILQLARLKGNGKEPKIIVWGCLAERYKDLINAELPEVDGFFGVEPYYSMERFLFGESGKYEDPYAFRFHSVPSHSAYLKIADGCDHMCTFCAIPHFKGKYKSRSIDSLVREAEMLAEKGVLEIILVAQDTSAWDSDRKDGKNITDLLERLIAVKGIQWIRILYGHPSHIQKDLIELIASEEKICSYLDVPFQHISDSILKAMGREHGKEKIERLIEMCRSRIPELVLRTTFIVGFPGETEAMFRELADFVRDVRFERLGAFTFSPEEGTKASGLRFLVSEDVARERYEYLMEIQQSISMDNNQSLVGETIPVIVDGYDKEQNSYYGRTQGDAPEIDQTVWIKGKAQTGTIIPIRIEVSSAYDLAGSVVY